ncbi:MULTISPECIES: hypothetical protein [Actinosynnema]|uniref:hypothetical protein n=1 Tax=Actinosynnema TaxID=40566 RepID=UPI0020A587C8|nr:hypothetical protein [Actinosynnema pretiosum]MCP2099334.1 hypothetical protein [Actinosynnema pretiosum]
MHPVVIDVGTRDTRKALIGGVVALVLGVMALVGAVSAYGDGEFGGGTIALVIGVVFTGIGILPIITWKKLSRPRKLVFEAPGVRWDDPQGAAWAVGWVELGAVSVSRTKEPIVSPSNLVRRTMVRLDLFPADPAGFAARHPQMARLALPDGRYRLPLGDSAGLIPVMDGALRQAAGPRYRGVVDEGFSVGLT